MGPTKQVRMSINKIAAHMTRAERWLQGAERTIQKTLRTLLTATDNLYDIRRELQELQSTRQTLQRQFNDLHHQHELELSFTTDTFAEQNTPPRKKPALQPQSPTTSISNEDTILQATIHDRETTCKEDTVNDEAQHIETVADDVQITDTSRDTAELPDAKPV